MDSKHSRTIARYKMKHSQLVTIATDVFNEFGWNYVEFHEQLTHVYFDSLKSMKLSDAEMQFYLGTIYNALDNSLTSMDFITRLTKDPMVLHDYEVLIHILHNILHQVHDKTSKTNNLHLHISIVRIVGGETMLCF
jgi:hypothetical protein